MAIPPIYSQSNQTTPTVVDAHGQLKVEGNQIVDQYGDPIQLRGMSLFWSQWMGQFYNSDAVRWLRDDWKITVIRAAMAVEEEGYLTNPEEEKNKVIEVVEAAIELGVYVIVDWHDHNAHHHTGEAENFFREMAQRFGDYPNVIWEPYNEPLPEATWSGHLKPYHETIISAIRESDPDNIVVAGTRSWSQDVDEAAADPLDDPNVAYTLHFYAGTHAQRYRDKARDALDRGVALFVTEWGTSEATGDGNLATGESRIWLNFLDDNDISWANWSITDKNETSAALQNDADPNGNWGDANISPSGHFIRDELRAKYAPPVLSPTPTLFSEKKANIYTVLGAPANHWTIPPGTPYFYQIMSPTGKIWRQGHTEGREIRLSGAPGSFLRIVAEP